MIRDTRWTVVANAWKNMEVPIWTLRAKHSGETWVPTRGQNGRDISLHMLSMADILGVNVCF